MGTEPPALTAILTFVLATFEERTTEEMVLCIIAIAFAMTHLLHRHKSQHPEITA